VTPALLVGAKLLAAVKSAALSSVSTPSVRAKAVVTEPADSSTWPSKVFDFV